MRIWLDQQQFEPKGFDYVISGSGTLVRVEFAKDAEAAEFAEAFGGFVSQHRPSMDGSKGLDTKETSAEMSASHRS
jgi:hypothetical protein